VLAIAGYGSKIVKELLPLLPVEECPRRVQLIAAEDRWKEADRVLFCSGLLRARKVLTQTQGEIAESFLVNCGLVMRHCDRMLAIKPRVRICVVGSESAYLGSHDGVYAAAKAGLHAYVERVKIKPQQQIVCVSPGIIEDAGMTVRREDRVNLARRRDMHPKRRFLRAIEVARMIHFLLYVDEGYTSGVVIRMNGGAHG
jgi:NAD(P)-dependent dehydrogenase (short-subunit alcohol dehydrogenase family)